MHVKITIDVTYDAATVDDVDDLKEHLRDEVRRWIGSGGLSSSDETVVDDWDVSVTHE